MRTQNNILITNGFILILTKTKPKNFVKNFAGTPIYTNKSLTTPIMKGGKTVILEIPFTVLCGNKYEDGVN